MHLQTKSEGKNPSQNNLRDRKITKANGRNVLCLTIDRPSETVGEIALLLCLSYHTTNLPLCQGFF